MPRANPEEKGAAEARRPASSQRLQDMLARTGPARDKSPSGRMTWRIAIFVAPLAASASAIAHQSLFDDRSRIPVTLTDAAEEQMARRLETAVRKALKRDPRFTLTQSEARPVLNISLPTRVGSERRLDWTEIHYQARLTAPDGRSWVIAGHCWNWNLEVCAKQILDAAGTPRHN